MTEEEYRKKAGELYKEYQDKQKELEVEFALSNNEVKIGDVVADNSCMIIVEKIKVDRAWSNHLPSAYFEGTRLTKKFVAYKSGERATVYNVKQHFKAENL